MYAGIARRQVVVAFSCGAVQLWGSRPHESAEAFDDLIWVVAFVQFTVGTESLLFASISRRMFSRIFL
jgi:hypothetical protein